MTQSFTVNAPESLARPTDSHRKVLVTGAAGNIGSYFSEHSHDRYDLRLMERELDEKTEKIKPFGELVLGELSDLEKLKEYCTGIDTVVHLAADPSPSAQWSSIIENNITGTYNTMVAAKAAGCRRVIYASSIHAVSGYPADVQVKTNEAVNPGDLYGVSKCFGEALGRYMAEQEGLSVIAIRIGAFQPEENAIKADGINMLDAWVSQRDLTQLIQRCIDVENLKFAIFHGLSDNRFKRLDISDARALVGYQPQDDLTEVNVELKDLHLGREVGSHSQKDGGKAGIEEELEALT